MASIAELLARAAALRDETALNSISPERAGGIMYDTLVAMNELWLQQGAALVISKIYASVEAMEADTAPVSDLTGQALRPGQIVVIASSDEDNGSVYRYDGTADDTSSWSPVGNIGAVPVVDDLTSDSSILALAARQGKVLDEKIGLLKNKVLEIADLSNFSQLSGRYYTAAGVYTGSNNWDSYKLEWGWPLTKIVVRASGGNVTDASIIAFYNSTTTFGASTLISSIQAVVGQTEYEANIPEGTKVIMVCNRTASFAAPAISAQSDVKSLVAKIDSVQGNVDTVYQYRGVVPNSTNIRTATLLQGTYSFTTANVVGAPSGMDTTGWLLVFHSELRLVFSADKIQLWVGGASKAWKKYLDDEERVKTAAVANSISSLASVINTGKLNGVYGFGGSTMTPAETIQEAFISKTTGQIVTYSGHSDWRVDKYPVTGGQLLRIIGSTNYGNSIYSIFDANDTLIELYTGGTELRLDYDGLVSIPSDAAYIYVGYVTGYTSGAVSIPTITPRWYGKKWVVIGDSLTAENIRTTKHYFDYIAEKTGITVVNMGVGGSGYKAMEGSDNAFYQRAQGVPLDADVITIFGSGNDMGNTLGTPTDTGTDTLCGCINTTLDNILDRYITNGKAPVIGVVTPTPWPTGTPASPTGQMSLYCDALKQCAERKSIPVLDLFRKSNLHPEITDFRPIAYSKDDGGGVHPDERGHEIIAPMFYNFLSSLVL